MGASTQFDRISSWLRGQQRSVERVNLGQASASDLVSTAEYELSRLREELDGVMLDTAHDVAPPSDIRDVGPLDCEMPSASSVTCAESSAVTGAAEPRSPASTGQTDRAPGRRARPRLAERLAMVSDDAA